MCSLCRLLVAKNHNFRQILTFLGAPVPMRAKFGAYSRPTAYVYMRNFVSVGLFCRPVTAKNRNFCRFLSFFGLRHLVVLPIGSSLRKLNTGAQAQTFPYPTVSKSFLHSDAFMAKSGAQSLTFKKRDEQTDKQINRQTKNSAFLAAPAAGEIRAPPNLAW